MSLQNLWQHLTEEGCSFIANSGFESIAGTSETDFVLIRNRSTTRDFRLKEFILSQGGNTNSRFTYQIYRNPVIASNGTGVTVNKIAPTHFKTSHAEVYIFPNISNRGVLVEGYTTDFNTFIRDLDLSRYLVSLNDLLLTITPSNGNIPHNAGITWSEVPRLIQT